MQALVAERHATQMMDWGTGKLAKKNKKRSASLRSSHEQNHLEWDFDRGALARITRAICSKRQDCNLIGRSRVPGESDFFHISFASSSSWVAVAINMSFDGERVLSEMQGKLPVKR